MKLPLILLSYGRFQDTRRIFSYERGGIHTLPVFTSVEASHVYQRGMNEALRESGKEALQHCVCNDPFMAVEMFETLLVHQADLTRIAINPTLSHEPEAMSLDEAIEILRSQLPNVEKSSDS
jgi:hypothetical protein